MTEITNVLNGATEELVGHIPDGSGCWCGPQVTHGEWGAQVVRHRAAPEIVDRFQNIRAALRSWRRFAQQYNRGGLDEEYKQACQALVDLDALCPLIADLQTSVSRQAMVQMDLGSLIQPGV